MPSALHEVASRNGASSASRRRSLPELTQPPTTFAEVPGFSTGQAGAPAIRQTGRSATFSFDDFLLEDRRTSPDQISLIPSLRRRAFGLAVRDGDSADENEMTMFVSGVTANNCPHDVLLYRPAFHNIRPSRATVRTYSKKCRSAIASSSTERGRLANGTSSQLSGAP